MPEAVLFLPRISGVGGLLLKAAGLAIFLHILTLPLFALAEISESDDSGTVIVNDAPEQEVYVIGKSVIVKKHAKGVLAIGGDVTIEGRVDGDVAAIGGNITQNSDAYIGGDVFVVGGVYKADSQTPLREPGKQTVMFDVFEKELRDLGENPTSLFSPAFSMIFVAQRLLVALLWFVISMVLATLAPGAVSRAVARLNLSALKVSALGSGVFLLAMAVLVGGAVVLPNFLGATIALMGTVLMLLAYVFGRVSLQVFAGKLIQKHLLRERAVSEALIVLLGVLFWTLLLSLPYVWLIALFTIFVVGVGLILTGSYTPRWQST